MPKSKKSSKKTSKKKKQQKAVGFRLDRSLGFLVVGLVMVVFSLGWSFYRQRILSFDIVPTEVLDRGGELPVEVRISKVNINLPIEESGIMDGVWQISYDGASHLNTSAKLGEGGNVVLYGHNRNTLLGPIRWLNVGDIVEVVAMNGDIYKYRVGETVTTTPDDISYVLPKNEEMLTIYTCTNFLDRDRFVIVAKPI